MRNNFNFEGHMQAIKLLAQRTIKTAEVCNSYLKKMSKPLIRKAVQELKKEFQEQYLKKDEEKLQTTIYALNLVLNQQVTNVDELFLDLAKDVNTFYEQNYLDLRKQLPFFLQCRQCHQYVSNYQLGRKNHESRCFRKKVAAPQKKIKLVDTKEKFERRQIRLSQGIQMSSVDNKESKKEQLHAKKIRKEQKVLKKCEKQQKIPSQDKDLGLQSFGQGDQYYFEDQDKSLEKDEKTQAKISSQQMRQIENADLIEDDEQMQDGYFV